MPSIGKMAAQMTLDSSQFTAGLQKGAADLSKFANQGTAAVSDFGDVSATSGARAAAAFSLGSRSVRQLGKAAGAANLIIADMAEGSTAAGKALIGAAQAAALAASGNYILAAVFAMKALVELFKRTPDEVDKAFGAVVDGSKNAQQALADIRLQGISQGVKELGENLAFFGSDQLRTILPGFMIDLNEVAEGGLENLARSVENKIAIFERLMNMPAIQAALEEARAARGAAHLEDLREELRLRGRTMGMTEEQIRLERIRRELPRGNAAETGGYLGSFLRQFVSGSDIDFSRIGGTEKILKQIEAWMKWQDEIKKSNQAFDEFIKDVRSQADALGSPFDRAAEAIANLNMAFELGIVDLDEYDQLVAGVLDKLDKATQMQQAAAPAALAAGSQAAYSAFSNIQRQEMGGGQADRLLRAAEREAESQERTLNESRRTRQILEDRLPQLGLAR